MKFTRLAFLPVALLFTIFSDAQTVVNTTGTTIKSADYIFEYSVGEIGITTLNDPSPAKAYFATQGLLQPGLKIIDPTCDFINDTLTYFPNPTRDFLALVPKYDWITSYRVYASDGKLVRIASFINNQINLSDLAPAVYFIRLLPGCNGKYRTLKVIKQ